MAGLPGDATKLKGCTSLCEECSENTATYKVQGETDSFGAEYMYMCEHCYNEMLSELRKGAEGICDWCKKEDDHLFFTRDPDEGMSGPVYMCCKSCINSMNERVIEDLKAMDRYEMERRL